MKEQKNIERLFQEKFKDFEALPSQDAWNNIASRLNEKHKKKRVIPFWFQLSGIAASLVVIGSLIWNHQAENSDFKPTNSVTVVEDSYNRVIDSETKAEAITNIDEDEEAATENNQNSSKAVVNQDKINKAVNSKSNVVIQTKQSKNANDVGIKFENSNRTKIVNSRKNNGFNKQNNDSRSNSIQSKDVLAKDKLRNTTNDGLVNSNQIEIATSRKNNLESNSNKNELLFGKENEQTKYTNNTTDLPEKNRIKSIRTQNEISLNDSTLVAKIAKEPNPLEEMLLAKEEGKNEVEKEKRNKWAISTNASPVYFNSLAEGSSLDAKLNSNQKNFNNTISVGLGLNYAISKKISVKTGVNSLKIDYSTNDIAFYQAPNAKPLNNINTNAMGKMIIIESKLEDNGNYVSVLGTPVIKYDGALKQQINFVEIPVELSYKILDKKFGIDFIGGMSTLFLTENNISIVSAGQEMNIGKANNLNNIHFSSNVGLGFKYNFWGNFNANFQPMFKYQINTFNENSGNFKPYFIGLYSGISFSF